MAEPIQTGKAFGKPPQDVAKMGSIIIILAASGLVRYEDVFCVLLASVYIYIMSRCVFPPLTLESPACIYKGSMLKVYITLAAYVGLYLPLAYIMLGVTLGDKKAVQAAATHTFLLACQVVSERVTSGLSAPARALIPILYNSGRLVSIWSWIRSDFFTFASVSKGPLSAAYWVLFGPSLAVANLVLWSYNLFYFLVPMYLPSCFHKYFEVEKAWSEQRSRIVKNRFVSHG